jgi:hypothetical protein
VQFAVGIAVAGPADSGSQAAPADNIDPDQTRTITIAHPEVTDSRLAINHGPLQWRTTYIYSVAWPGQYSARPVCGVTPRRINIVIYPVNVGTQCHAAKTQQQTRPDDVIFAPTVHPAPPRKKVNFSITLFSVMPAPPQATHSIFYHKTRLIVKSFFEDFGPCRGLEWVNWVCFGFSMLDAGFSILDRVSIVEHLSHINIGFVLDISVSREA